MQLRDATGNAVGNTEIIEISDDDTIAAIKRRQWLDRQFAAIASMPSEAMLRDMSVALAASASRYLG